MAARDSGQPCRRKGYDLSRIPAVILEPDTDADRLEMQLVENLARADMTPVDTAKAVKQLMDSLDPKPSLADLGKRLGRSKAWVYQMLSHWGAKMRRRWRSIWACRWSPSGKRTSVA